MILPPVSVHIPSPTAWNWTVWLAVGVVVSPGVGIGRVAGLLVAAAVPAVAGEVVPGTKNPKEAGMLSGVPLFGAEDRDAHRTCVDVQQHSVRTPQKHRPHQRDRHTFDLFIANGLSVSVCARDRFCPGTHGRGLGERPPAFECGPVLQTEGATVQMTRVLCGGDTHPVCVPAALQEGQALLLTPNPPIFRDGLHQLREEVSVGTFAVTFARYFKERGIWVPQALVHTAGDATHNQGGRLNRQWQTPDCNKQPASKASAAVALQPVVRFGVRFGSTWSNAPDSPGWRAFLR